MRSNLALYPLRSARPQIPGGQSAGHAVISRGGCDDPNLLAVLLDQRSDLVHGTAVFIGPRRQKALRFQPDLRAQLLVQGFHIQQRRGGEDLPESLLRRENIRDFYRANIPSQHHSSLLDLKDGFHFHGQAQWQGVGADSGSSVPPFFSKGVHKDLRCAVDDLRLPMEIIRAGYKT